MVPFGNVTSVSVQKERGQYTDTYVVCCVLKYIHLEYLTFPELIQTPILVLV